MNHNLDKVTLISVEKMQLDEITEYEIYIKLSKWIKDPVNSSLLKEIGTDNLKHYKVLKKYTQKDIKADKVKVFIYSLLTKLFGLTFGLKLMESREQSAGANYGIHIDKLPELKQIEVEENEHEQKIISMISERKIHFVGSIVLGLNDALIELSAALTGFTFALQSTKLIIIAGLITGISGAMSMSASEYLSLKAENRDINPLTGALFTGAAYLITVILLIIPFFLITNHKLALMIMLLAASLVVLVFSFYISVAQEISFTHRFIEMLIIVFGISFISYCIGFFINKYIPLLL